MISVDDRVGSIDLIPILQSLIPPLCSSKVHSSLDLSVSSTRLLSGDVCFDGHGPNSSHIMIGIERKRIKDMVNSIRSGRYSGSQLPDMLEYYDDCYLILEGAYRASPSGDLEILISKDATNHNAHYISGKWFPVQLGSSTIRYTELHHFLCTLLTHTRVRLLYSFSPYDTASQLISLYTHYQSPYSSHHSHQAIHVPQTMVTIGKAGFVRRVASQMAGVGWEKSAAVALKFRTGVEMANAGPKEWESIKPGFGKMLAKRAFDQWRGEYKERGEL